ncbi:MAG: GDP-L-fucose synthase [Candidatus Argoarchaeum ethanivorans]|uniref:GDP-L-fucose synthase n=1 Tax=Candidatus Argoarchaeum ethanivorans TaxID=2608793 RepID=A0A811T8N2_9EURY|nr:MAG: GDP-L-fucose synthase [Candidatus Argoarchaeum ethanivorans]
MAYEMNKKDSIFIAGHKGMVGSAIMRALQNKGYSNIITATRQELDLRDAKSVEIFFNQHSPDYVFLAAAKVGGIQANMQYPGDFLYDNLMIQNNVIYQSNKSGVKKLAFLGSSCIYPKDCPQPIKEEYLMTGPLEPTNEGYALAKIAGLRLAQYYHKQYGLNCINPMPCNLYGTNDSFDPDNSHVLSALVRKFVDATDENKKEEVLWGSGIARREFMHVDDLSQAVLFLVEEWDSPEIINVGCGTDISIKELAELIANKVEYTGRIVWDTNMPDGMLKKCLDVSKLQSLGFYPSITLENGIDQVITEYRNLKLEGAKQ